MRGKKNKDFFPKNIGSHEIKIPEEHLGKFEGSLPVAERWGNKKASLTVTLGVIRGAGVWRQTVGPQGLGGRVILAEEAG